MYAQMAQNQHTTITLIKPFASKFQPFGHVQVSSEEIVWENGKIVFFLKVWGELFLLLTL